ncbi:hypothetical protein N0V86_002362 [Didymella sp. IMI 355093]|nr:hypothetical protein N0V86_002362 [Didymella sp. IMI 355093]
MRLLYFDDHGEVSLTGDLLGNDKIPPYAILSHTWGKEEVTFDDIMEGTGKEKIGHNKIRFCMQQAAESGLQYSWVDTCCINKNDFTELQHAINSFFRWYRDAAICYVFLSDVPATKRKADSEIFQSTWEPAFRDSRWFTRGWTLQELLAPRYLKFYSQEGKALGDIQELKHLIHSITDLPVAALMGASLEDFEIEERLCWTENRTTTREEDKAYSLLGILGVFMPLIYGEGLDNAFRRLRKEIQDRKYLTLGIVRTTFIFWFPAISVEEENGDDIRWYVEERLRDFHPYLKGVKFLDEVLTKARGAFQWVFLVTERMRTKILIGGKAESLLRDLAICPDSLNEMYATLVQGGTASEKRQMRKLFQWIMFAERPLSAQELREALATDAAKSYQSVKELRSQDCWSDTLDDFESMSQEERTGTAKRN